MGSRLRVASLVALGLAFAAPALADPTAAEKETARNLMDEGHTLRDEKKDPSDALERFLAADQIMRVPITGYEVAVTQVQLGRLVEARETLARVLASPGKKTEPLPFRQARSKAQRLDDALAARIPTLVINIHGPSQGAGVTIDGAAVPASLIGLPSRANPGHHAITVATARMQGHAEVDLGEGDKKEVTVELAPKPVDHDEAAIPEPPPKPPEEHHGARTAGIVLLGVGVAGLVAGGVTGVLTFTTQSDLEIKCPNHVCGPESHDELVLANTLATVSTVSFIAGGALAVIGVVTFVAGKPKAAPQTGLRVAPWIGPGSAGLRGTF